MVPTMIYAVLDHPDREKYDTSSLRNVLYGAAPIAPERLREAIEAFGLVFTQAYGQTEAPMVLTTLSREEHVLQGEDQQGTVAVAAPAAARLLPLTADIPEQNRLPGDRRKRDLFG